MRSIVNELKQSKYWDMTYDRMLKKENFSDEQLMDIMLMNNPIMRDSIIDEIINNKYEWSIPRKIEINKMGTTKKRVVYMYSMKDRFVSGVLYRLFSDFYINNISTQCFSYKRGIKTSDAIKYLKKNIDLQNSYGVKIDIHAYFNSVKEDALKEIIKEISNNEDCIYKLLSDLYFDDRTIYRNKELHEYKSLIPGTAFASFLANYVLKDIDKEIEKDTNIAYARYSDDIIIIGNNQDILKEKLSIILSKLKELGLTVNEEKYKWFKPGDEVDFLGLKIKDNGCIDISDSSFNKTKKKIKHQCEYGRRLIHRLGKDPDKVAKNILSRYNYRVYKCYIQDASKFGWAYYAFRYIDTIDTIRQLDFYLKDRIRQMITNKNNSANTKKVSDEKLKELGYISLVEMFIKFRTDFDYYCDAVDLI